MKKHIEEYRGWDISFDTNSETFVCDCISEDVQQKRGSYSAAKKGIDDYIKLNAKFEPFYIEELDNWSNQRIVKVVGIRKDGRLMIEASDGCTQLSVYHQKNYAVYNPENETFWKELNKLKAKKEEIDEAIKVLRITYKPGVSIDEYIKRFA